MVLNNVTPQADTTRSVVLNLTQVLNIEQLCNVVSNLVNDTNGLVGLEVLTLVSSGFSQRVDILQQTNITVNQMESNLTSGNASF